MTDYLKNILHKNNLRVTRQRLEIIGALHKKSTPASYAQLKGGLKMDKATFYRNVEKLESAGVLTQIELSDGWYFELTTHQHAHFLCKSCDDISCLPHMPALEGFEVETALFKGVCPRCR